MGIKVKKEFWVNLTTINLKKQFRAIYCFCLYADLPVFDYFNLKLLYTQTSLSVCMHSSLHDMQATKSTCYLEDQRRISNTGSSISTQLSTSQPSCMKDDLSKKQKMQKLLDERIDNLKKICHKIQEKTNLKGITGKDKLTRLSIFQQKGRIVKNQQIFKQLRTENHGNVCSIQKREQSKSNTLILKAKSPKKAEYFCPPTTSEKLLKISGVKRSIPSKQEYSTKTEVLKEHQYSSTLSVSTPLTRIKQFKVVKFLDEGKFGKVYLSQSISNGMIYSIKSIYRSSLDENALNQLIREVKIQQFLNHPNIVKLYGFFVDSTSVYLVLEPCLQKNLYQNLKQVGRIKQKMVRQIMKQVCTAVQYMHKNNVIHRDLKPQNILVHENMIKICDFGWAIHSHLMRNTQCGTLLYTSPQVVTKEFYDSKIDIWSIGVLTYELLYGTIPFQIRQLSDMDKIIHQQVYFSQSIGVSEAAKDFMMGCLHKDPKKRLSIIQLLDHEFLNKIDKYRMTM